MNLTSPAIPIFRIFDEAKAKEFYVGYLGCEVQWEHRFADTMPLYMEVSRGDLRLHLSEHHGDGTPGSAILVVVDDLVPFHSELRAKTYRFLNPGIGPGPAEGSLCMDLMDPFGNRLSFMQRMAGDDGES